MLKLHGRILINAALDDIYNSLIDISSWPKWWSALNNANCDDDSGLISDGSFLTGCFTPHRLTYKLSGKITIKKGHEISLRYKRFGLSGKITWTLGQSANAVTVDEKVKMAGFMLVIYRTMGQHEALANMVKKSLNALKNMLEQEICSNS